jgi:hypothetical protein
MTKKGIKSKQSPNHAFYQKRYYFERGGKEYLNQWEKKNSVSRAVTLFRDSCPKCGFRGRFRLRYVMYKTGRLYYKCIEITHWRMEGGKKIYYKTCHLWGKEMYDLLNSLSIVNLPKENKLKK